MGAGGRDEDDMGEGGRIREQGEQGGPGKDREGMRAGSRSHGDMEKAVGAKMIWEQG